MQGDEVAKQGGIDGVFIGRLIGTKEVFW